MSEGTVSSAAAVWRDGVLRSLVAFDPSQPRDDQGQWTSDGSDQSAAAGDEEAKRLYAAMINMTPEQRDAFLAGLNNDQLTRLAAFAGTGKATDGPIADIRNRAGQAMAGRGLDPGRAGLKSKGGKKKSAGKKGGSKGGGSKGGGGGKSSGGGGRKSSGGGGSKSSGGGGSSKKKAPAKNAPPKKSEPPAKPPAKPKPVVAPVVTPTRPRRPPTTPPKPPGTNPVRGG